MSVEFKKTGIIQVSGEEIGNNILLNGSAFNGISNWNVSRSNLLSVVTVDNEKCFQIKSTSSDSARAYIYQVITPRVNISNLGTFTISYYYKAESVNQTSGVGAFVRVANQTSQYNDRINSTSSLILDNEWHFCSKTGDLSEFNGTNATSMTFYLFAFNGTVLYKKVKLELGTTPTPWIPNQSDSGVVPTLHGFAEHGTQMSVYPNHIITTEFIEY